MTIKSEANVAPISSTFGVKFSSNSTKLETNNITPTGNGSAAIINNDGNPTIKNLNASFTSPGEKVVYKFYVLNTNGDKVNLIMDRNICSDGTKATSSNTCFVQWITKEDYISAGGTESDWGTQGNNNKGTITALKYLNEATSSWTNIPSLNEIYTDDRYGSISLTGRARLPKNSELKSYFSAFYLFNYLNKLQFSTSKTQQVISGIYGYWSITAPVPSTADSRIYVAYALYYNGGTQSTDINADKYGVRPVITLSKSDIQ